MNILKDTKIATFLLESEAELLAFQKCNEATKRGQAFVCSVNSNFFHSTFVLLILHHHHYCFEGFINSFPWEIPQAHKIVRRTSCFVLIDTCKNHLVSVCLSSHPTAYRVRTLPPSEPDQAENISQLYFIKYKTSNKLWKILLLKHKGCWPGINSGH